eukprot:1140742-Pelagomonas_calceolata.AAC.1
MTSHCFPIHLSGTEGIPKVHADETAAAAGCMPRKNQQPFSQQQIILRKQWAQLQLVVDKASVDLNQIRIV